MDEVLQNWERADTAHIFKGEGRGRETRNYTSGSLVSIPEKMLNQNKPT